jgi:hypothetical protein
MVFSFTCDSHLSLASTIRRSVSPFLCIALSKELSSCFLVCTFSFRSKFGCVRKRRNALLFVVLTLTGVSLIANIVQLQT